MFHLPYKMKCRQYKLSTFSTGNTNFIIILPHLRLNTGFSAGSRKFSTCNTKGTHTIRYCIASTKCGIACTTCSTLPVINLQFPVLDSVLPALDVALPVLCPILKIESRILLSYSEHVALQVCPTSPKNISILSRKGFYLAAALRFCTP